MTVWVKEVAQQTDRRHRRRLRFWATTAAIFVVVVARCFLFDDFAANEVDVLPSARQSVETTWIPGDWYLNLDIGYRPAFNALFGPMVSELGFRTTAVVGRLLAFLLFAIAIAWLFRTLSILPGIGLLFLIVFLNNQSLFAGEWMVLGFETKALAYPIVLFGVVAAVRNKWRWSAAFVGAALSLHILVGLYATLAWEVPFVIFVLRPHGVRVAAKSIWPFAITGSWGIVAIIDQLAGAAEGGNGGWNAYVSLRVPHHVTPDLWNDWYWPIIVGLFLVLALFCLRRSSSRSAQTVSAFGLGSLIPLLIGFVVWVFAPVEWMRFYWFRFPDVVLPLLTVILVAYTLSRYLDRSTSPDRRSTDSPGRMRRLLRRVPHRAVDMGIAGLLVGAALVQIAAERDELASERGWAHTEYSDLLDWISHNTNPDERFLVDPSWQEFYVRAERSMFVSFRHSPQSAVDLTEWNRRMVLCNGGNAFQSAGFGLQNEVSNSFNNLSDTYVRQLAKVENLDYYVATKDASRSSLVPIHSDGDWTIYRLD